MIKKTLLTITLSLGLGIPAFADDTPTEVGAVVTYAPAQAGLTANKLKVFPWFQKEYSNGWYAIVRKGVGKYVVNSDTTKLGIGLWADLGRKTSDHDRLKNLKEVKASPAVNINFDSKLSSRNSVSGFVETSVREHKGTRAQFAFRRNLTANTESMLFTNGELYTQFVDTKYAQAYYGVTAADATASGFSAYSASSGIDRIGARFNIQKNLGERIYIKSSVSAGVTSGPAKASPISNSKSYMGIAIVFGTYF